MTFPILSFLIILPLIGSFFIIFVKNSARNISIKALSLFISISNLFLAIYLWIIFDKSNSNFQFVENREWILGLINY